MPLIWDNVGNLNNLMVGPDGLVGIDQQVAVLADAARAAERLRSAKWLQVQNVSP